MQQEYSSIMDNGTWELVDLFPGRVVVNIMWIYKVKSNTLGDASRFKAWVIAKGCSQRVGLDYTETFCPLIRMASLRLFLAIAAARDLELCQLPIDTAFHYASITEDVYIRQPLGFSDGTSKVCHLKRCLYGLNQSPREFNMPFRAWLVDNGWQQYVSNPSTYIFRAGHVFVMIAVCADAIHAAYNEASRLTSSKAQLGARLKIKDLGDLSQLLGMHITRDRSARTISLDQPKYLRDILAKYGMTHSKPSSLPMGPGFMSGLAHMASTPLTGLAKDVYPILLGNLQYTAVCTRPDVSTTLSILGSAQVSPTDIHMHALKKVLRYLHGTIDMRMTLGGSTDHNLQLTCFADADWENDSNTRKSRSGYLFTLGREPISYKFKQQTCVAQSTCEAEYYSAVDATKEGLRLCQLMGQIFNAPITETTTI
jgi:hypothetical protein